MLTQKQKDQYYRDGYLLVRDILTAEEVRWLRAFFRSKFDSPGPPPNTDQWLVDIFGRCPESRWLCFHEPTLKVVRSLFGNDIVLLPESAAHLNYFGRWHKDTGHFDRAGHDFFKEKQYEMWGLGYYLQENTAEYGGGLDVEPGSHRQAVDPFIKPVDRRSILRRIWGHFHRSARRKYWRTWIEHEGYVPDQVVSIPSLPGDMVIFDSRVNHRATPARGVASDKGWVRRGTLPFEHEKIALFSSWSRNNSTAHTYMKWNRIRPEYPHLLNFSYPADFVKQAENAGINLIV